MEKIQQQTTKYKDKCKVCGKEIIGTSKEQVNYNMKIHNQQKHKKGTKNE